MTIGVLVRLVAPVLPLWALAGSAAAQPLEHPPVRVQITAAVRDHVSGVAWNAMKDECQRIWLAERVVIIWNEKAPKPSPDDVQVPLIVDEEEFRKHAPRRGDTFGLTVFAGRTQRMLVSVSRVRTLVSARGRIVDRRDSLLFDAAVGRVLGRVVAHEIGHVLLLSTRHATTGLMGPALQVRHLGAFDPELFALSAPDRERLAATRFANARESRPPMSAPASTVARGSGAGAISIVPITFREAP